MELRNLSATEHPFHLHGMRFEVLSRDGVPPAAHTLEDTVNLGLHETVRVRVLADNEGFWMTHCHILPHADGGMMTVLQVGDPRPAGEPTGPGSGPVDPAPTRRPMRRWPPTPSSLSAVAGLTVSAKAPTGAVVSTADAPTRVAPRARPR